MGGNQIYVANFYKCGFAIEPRLVKKTFIVLHYWEFSSFSLNQLKIFWSDEVVREQAPKYFKAGLKTPSLMIFRAVVALSELRDD